MDNMTSADLDIICCNELQGIRPDAAKKGLFYQSDTEMKICNILINFVKYIYSTKDHLELKYINGCSVIRHFKNALIMIEIFSKCKYTDELIAED
jgi:hypothetical protein